MTTQVEQAQMMVKVKNSSSPSHMMKEDRDEEMTRSALATFHAREEEIERRKIEVRDKVQTQLGRVEEETKRLALIREVISNCL